MKQIIFFVSCVAIHSIAFAQAVSQADVSISAITLSPSINNNGATIVTKPSTNISVDPNTQKRIARLENSNDLKCSITVHNENDDDAKETMLVVVLPVEVNVTSLPANGTAHKYGNFAGYVSFDLGYMTVGQNITVEFTFTKSKYGNKVGAYAYSSMSDPNPANNYKDTSF